MSKKESPQKIAPSRVAELITAHLHEQVERASALIAGAIALLPEDAAPPAINLLNLALDDLYDLGEVEHLRRLMIVVQKSGMDMRQSPGGCDD